MPPIPPGLPWPEFLSSLLHRCTARFRAAGAAFIRRARRVGKAECRAAAVAMAAMVGATSPAAAQASVDAQVPAAPAPASGMADRVLACTACHGREGRATQQGYFPRIAGKPAGYLYHQLLNFRDGRRSYPQMSYLLEHMTDDYLREIARHFSALDLPYAAPPPPQAPPAALERGRRLVREGDAARGIPACVQCHGGAMTGVQPAIPALIGLPRDYLNSQIGAWQTGQRRSQAPDCMARVARQLTAEDVSAISAWLAAQPVAGSGKPADAPAGPLPMPCGGVDMSARGSTP